MPRSLSRSPRCWASTRGGANNSGLQQRAWLRSAPAIHRMSIGARLSGFRLVARLGRFRQAGVDVIPPTAGKEQRMAPNDNSNRSDQTSVETTAALPPDDLAGLHQPTPPPKAPKVHPVGFLAAPAYSPMKPLRNHHLGLVCSKISSPRTRLRTDLLTGNGFIPVLYSTPTMAGAVDRPRMGSSSKPACWSMVFISLGEGIAESRGLACADGTRTAAQP